jgi:exonuclease VII large subunit
VRDLPSVYATRLAAADERLRAWPSRTAFPHVLEGLARDERALAIRMRAILRSAGEWLGSLAVQLSAIDPLRVLSRGYSITYREGGTRPLRRGDEVAVGDAIRVLLSDGEVSAEVREVRAGGPERRTGGAGS